MSSLSETGMKQRLEHGLWIDEVDRSFKEWRLAPNGEKPAKLLAGMVLTWAESWRLTNPEDFSPAHHSFITRSLAAQTQKASSERAADDLETRRRDKVYQHILLLMALFVIVVLGPSTAKIYFRQFEGEETTVEARPKSERAPKPVASHVVVQEPLPERVVVPERQSWPARRLIDNAEAAARVGDRRQAALFALEALGPVRAGQKAPAIEEVVKARSVLTETARQTTGMPAAAELPEGAAVQACGGHRFIAVSGLDTWVLEPTRAVGQRRRSAEQIMPLQLTAIDKDCQRVLVAGPDHDLQVVSISTDKAPKRLGTHDATLVAYTFSGDGRRILSVSRDAVGKIWDAEKGKPIASFRAEAQIINGGTISPDGAKAVTWSDEKSVDLWDAGSGKLQARLAGHSSQVLQARFSADSRMLLTTSFDGTAIVWDSHSHVAVARLVPPAAIIDAWLSGDSRHAVLRLETDQLQIWNITSQTVAATIDLGGSGSQVVVVSPDGSKLALLQPNGRISVRALATGQRQLDLNGAGATVLSLAFDTDGRSLTALTSRGAVQWSLAMATADLEAADLEAVARKLGPCWTVSERQALGLDSRLPNWCPGDPSNGSPRTSSTP